MTKTKDDILSYREMCDIESAQTLQRGMNFRFSPGHSVILMSQRRNAPYNDQVSEDGITITYEGHDWPTTKDTPVPKSIDQPLTTASGSLTQNGKFVQAIEESKRGAAREKVRVYEKLLAGVWSYKGLFDLTDYLYESDGHRKVFRFTLTLTNESASTQQGGVLRERSRVIPTEVKKIVWERDGGKCVMCGAKDELHFDHDIPYSKGGTSITAENVRILCARHNLSKSDKIE